MPAVIWLLRHADAEDEPPDPAAGDAGRALTDAGERQAAAVGAALKRLGVDLETCLTSPKTRASATARIACEPLEVPVIESEALRGGDFDPQAVTAGHGEEVLLVGHEPDFSRAIQALTGARVKLKKGGLAAIDGRTLTCLLRSDQVAAIAATAARE
jgi:phosphohistidine phosphatase